MSTLDEMPDEYDESERCKLYPKCKGWVEKRVPHEVDAASYEACGKCGLVQ